MPRISFTSHLRRFFPTLGEEIIDCDTIAGIIAELDRRYPGLASYLIDEQGSLRKHVNVFVGESLIHDRATLSDGVTNDDHVYIMQALSGG